MILQSLENCKLGIGSYPIFTYNATGGGGKATATKERDDRNYKLTFESNRFSIPDMTSKNTRILKLPIPPGCRIKMAMKSLTGYIDSQSGDLTLNFESRFTFILFNNYYFPELYVNTVLSTNSVKHNHKIYKGSLINKQGNCVLVGSAIVPKCGNKLLDLFLGLPTNALAILNCNVKIPADK